MPPHSRCIRGGRRNQILLHLWMGLHTSNLPHHNCPSATEIPLYCTHSLCVCQRGHETLLIHSHTLSSGFILCERQISGLPLSGVISASSLHDGAFIYTHHMLASRLTVKFLTQRHYREVFAAEFAGYGDFLPQGPASLGNHMMCSRWRVMAHLKGNTDIKVKCDSGNVFALAVSAEQRSLDLCVSVWESHACLHISEPVNKKTPVVLCCLPAHTASGSRTLPGDRARRSHPGGG